MRLLYLLVAAAVCIATPSCSHNEKDHDHDHDHDHGHHHEAEAHEHHDDEESDEIILKPDMAKRMGVETEHVTPDLFYEVIRVNGQIVPSPSDVAVAVAPTSGIVTLSGAVADGKQVGAGARLATVSAKNISGGDVDEAGRRAIEAAKRELDRLRPLYQEGLVTAKDFNEAQARYDAAVAAYSPKAASGSVTTPISGVITKVFVNQGQFVDTGQPIAEVSKTSTLTLRADLPEKYYSQLNTIRSANFKPNGAERTVSIEELGGKRTSAPSAATAQNGYFPIYFTFKNDNTIAPGSYVEVFLTGQPRSNAIVVPVEALTEQQGEKYVYVKIDEEGYERRMVKTGGSDGKRVEILSGLKSGEEVVTKGATAVRLAENSGAIPEGHSHNH